LGFAVIFAVVSLILGFGLGLAIASGFIGAASGLAFFRRSSVEPDSPSRAILKQAFQGSAVLAPAHMDLWLFSQEGSPRQWGTARKLHLILSPLFSGSPFQRVANAAFLMQAGIGVAAILIFRAAQAAGINLQFVDASPLAGLFADTFAISAEATVARARFDYLFLPLVSLCAITFPLFGLAFLSALGPILRDVKANWRYLTLPLFAYGFWLSLTYVGSSGNSLQKLVISGNAWGYFVYLVLFPLFFLLMSASLPSDAARH
jgi:hypothetical protein